MDLAVAPRIKRATTRILDPEILRGITGYKPEPPVTESVRVASSRMLLLKLHELEQENKRLRGALAKATAQLDAMSTQVALAGKLLGRRARSRDAARPHPETQGA